MAAIEAAAGKDSRESRHDAEEADPSPVKGDRELAHRRIGALRGLDPGGFELRRPRGKWHNESGFNRAPERGCAPYLL